MHSIIQTEKECWLCGDTRNLELHHCIHGTANRKLADKYGLTIWLCRDCHTAAPDSVHRNPRADKILKSVAQRAFEETHGSRFDFIKIFGKSYL